jgi:hypothetical protein
MQRPTTRTFGPLGLAALTALAAAACGGSSGGKFDQYVGTWQYTQILAPLNCDTAQPLDASPVANKVFQDAIGASLVDVSVSSIDRRRTCDFTYDVSGMTATMGANQSCLLSDGTATVQPTQWRFTLLGPNQAEEVGSALVHSLTLVDSTGTALTVDCDLSFQATLTRVATD